MPQTKIIDISPMLHEEVAVWPGDTPLSRELLCDISKGSNIDLSTIRTTVHLGAHADAPRHYHQNGKTIESVDLDPYIGPCVVITVPQSELIEPEHCRLVLETKPQRVLFKTGSFPNPDRFNKNFSAFSPSTVELLGKAGVKLIGIDTPSVDPFHSKDLPAHQMLYRYKMANLEGLVLDGVQEGAYELIALPLALKGFDASPVRAVLRRI